MCVRLLTEDLRYIVDWANINGLKRNASKTQSIVVYKYGVDIVDTVPYSTFVKNLRVTYGNDLKSDMQVDLICRRVFHILRSLWRTARFVGSVLKRRLFLYYILPHFIFSGVVLFGMSKGCMAKLNRCFKACVRYVFRLKKYDHITF